MQDVIEKLKKAKLTGRGGAGFPTWLKWDLTKKAVGKKKFVICNASEGELNVFKDAYIIEHYPDEVINGIKIALANIDNSTAYLYINKKLYSKYKVKLKKLIGDAPIEIFKKNGGYIAGEETSVCEALEGRRPEPRVRPPYTCNVGIWCFPTLVNNVETFYHVSKIEKGEYKKTRFYSISGDVRNEGIYEFPISYSIEKILKDTKNYPRFNFFVQQGGGASGEILLKKECKKKATGLGAIVLYNQKKTDPMELMKKWTDFFMIGNCDKCVPCREGLYRIKEMLNENAIDTKLLKDLFLVLEQSSFCALGTNVPRPFRSLITKVMKIKI